jgi:hypothetical protein
VEYKSIKNYATTIAIIRNLTSLTEPRRPITWLTESFSESESLYVIIIGILAWYY